MNSKRVRTIIAAIVFIVLCAGLIAGINMGTLSGFGWETISALCPLGALTTMIASKTFLPRALISFLLFAVVFLVLGRAFCAWICPVGLLDRIREFFRSPRKAKALRDSKRAEVHAIAKSELAKGCTHNCASCGGCSSIRKQFDSRHVILGGALLSTAVFGFPVFCLICPIGLTFATVLVFWRIFAAGDMSWAIVIVPAMLIIELVFLRKWCGRFCPLAGLMTLFSRFGKTFVPVIDDSKCIEVTKGVPCSKCAEVCDYEINLRHPEFGEKTIADCARCRACVDACPTKAISMPFKFEGGVVKVRDNEVAASGE